MDLDDYYPASRGSVHVQRRAPVHAAERLLAGRLVDDNVDPSSRRRASTRPEEGWTWPDFLCARGWRPTTASTCEVSGIAPEHRSGWRRWSGPNGGDIVDDLERAHPAHPRRAARRGRRCRTSSTCAAMGLVPTEAELAAQDHRDPLRDGQARMLLSSRRRSPPLRRSPVSTWDVAPLPRPSRPGRRSCTLTRTASPPAASPRKRRGEFIEFATGTPGPRLWPGRPHRAALTLGRRVAGVPRPTRPPSLTQVFLDADPGPAPRRRSPDLDRDRGRAEEITPCVRRRAGLDKAIADLDRRSRVVLARCARHSARAVPELLRRLVRAPVPRCAASTSTSPPGEFAGRGWARPARASPPCCGSSPGSSRSTRDVLLGGRDVTGAPRTSGLSRWCSRVRAVPAPHGGDNIGFGRAARGGPAARPRAASEVADGSGRAACSPQPGELSGGERQRVALARALVRGPASSCSTSRCPASTPSCGPLRAEIEVLQRPGRRRCTSPTTRPRR